MYIFIPCSYSDVFLTLPLCAGDTAGAARPFQPNLRPANNQAFVDYLVDVVEQYSKDPNWNLKFDYLEPFNEPDEGYWRKGNGQEGCYFPATQIAEVAKRTVATLHQRKLKTKLVAVDSWAGRSPPQFQYMTPDVMGNLSSFQVHGYADPGQFRQNPPGKPGPCAGKGTLLLYSIVLSKVNWCSLQQGKPSQ